jgi:hypothetical protein
MRRINTIERGTPNDQGHLENRITIDDPGAYSRPFTTTYVATLSVGDELMEYIGSENNLGFEN